MECQLNRSAQLSNGVIIKLIATWLLFAPSIGDLALLNDSRFIPYDKAITDARSVVMCVCMCVCNVPVYAYISVLRVHFPAHAPASLYALACVHLCMYVRSYIRKPAEL